MVKSTAVSLPLSHPFRSMSAGLAAPCATTSLSCGIFASVKIYAHSSRNALCRIPIPFIRQTSMWSPKTSRASLHNGQGGNCSPMGIRGRPSQCFAALLKSASPITVPEATLGVTDSHAVANGPAWEIKRTRSLACPLVRRFCFRFPAHCSAHQC